MRYKQKQISCRVSNEVWEKLQKMKKDSGLSKRAILSKLIMDNEVRAPMTEELLRIYKELNHIGNNINQIAHIVNCEKHVSSAKINGVADLMDKVWDCVRSYGEEGRS